MFIAWLTCMSTCKSTCKRTSLLQHQVRLVPYCIPASLVQLPTDIIMYPTAPSQASPTST